MNTLQTELISSLTGQNAHVSFENTIRDFPEDKYNLKAKGVEYSCWDQLEHMRIAQKDILDFIVSPNYESREWPEAYWPAEDADRDKWNESITKFLRDRESIEKIVRFKPNDLLSELPHAPGYTLLREILLVIDHNAYHTGQILVLRKILGIWKA